MPLRATAGSDGDRADRRSTTDGDSSMAPNRRIVPAWGPGGGSDGTNDVPAAAGTSTSIAAGREKATPWG